MRVDLILFLNCFIQVISHLAGLIMKLGLLERCALECVLLGSGRLVCIIVLLFLSLAPRLLESLEEIVRGELFAFRCHHHRLLHRLLLVEVFDLAEGYALHAAGGGACRVSQDQGVIFCIAARLWRQI